MPDPESPQPFEPPSDFFIRIIETITGLCVVCILTLAFMSPLHWPGKISLCIFSLTLPVMVAVRIDISNAPSSGSLLRGNFDDFARAGACAAVVGFIFLLFAVFWFAAILFAAVCATLVILAPEPKRAENQPNPSPPPPDDVQTDN
jgi:hypothetical protein